MERLLLCVVGCSLLIGCQAPIPGFDALALGRQTRVPPPPTGAVGRERESSFRGAAPQLNDQSQTFSEEHYGTASDYWNSTAYDREPAAHAMSPPRSDMRIDDRVSDLTPMERSYWLDPTTSGVREPIPTYSEFAASESSVGGRVPGLLPGGPAAPRSSSGQRVRPRAFPSSVGRQEIGIPAELAEFRSGGIRQASAASSNWEQRYEDVRR